MLNWIRGLWRGTVSAFIVGLISFINYVFSPILLTQLSTSQLDRDLDGTTNAIMRASHYSWVIFAAIIIVLGFWTAIGFMKEGEKV